MNVWAVSGRLQMEEPSPQKTPKCARQTGGALKEEWRRPTTLDRR